MFDLDDIDVNLFAGHPAELFLELVNLRAFAANDDARSGGQDRNATAAGGALDINLRHRSGLEFLLQQLPNLAVLGEQFAKLLLAGVPLGAPIASHRDPQADWIGFLAHG